MTLSQVAIKKAGTDEGPERHSPVPAYAWQNRPAAPGCSFNSSSDTSCVVATRPPPIGPRATCDICVNQFLRVTVGRRQAVVHGLSREGHETKFWSVKTQVSFSGRSILHYQQDPL
jgi:hypothetical protein